MRLSTVMALSAAGLVLCVFLSSCVLVKQKPGGATPAEVLTRFDKALQDGDHDTLAVCCSSYEQANPKIAGEFADMLLMIKVVQPLIISGVKKYGATEFVNALGFGAIAISMAGSPQPTEVMLKHGQLSVTGDKAVYKYKVSKEGTEILPKQAELAQFEKAYNGVATENEISMELIKLHERWYIPSPDEKDMATCRHISQALKQYCPQVQTGIASSNDSKTFAAAMAAPNARLKEVLVQKK